MRAKIATLALVLVGLISIYQPLRLASLSVAKDDDVLVVLDRARCLTGVLPKDVHRYGSLILRPNENRSNAERRLFLLRSFMVPDLVTTSPDQDWIIGYYANQESGLRDLEGQNLTVVKDCGNGVFLLKR